ncbi:MAG TPA: ABC transporter substrate-binding protein [Gemmatimonadales bacterium]|nr:ABC transporter substrate-binding protein [Gemmatimonadales bacterium]
MRVVTLLPAATEIVAALGGVSRLVGISHECDYPESIVGLPRVTATPIDPTLPSARIDANVRRLSASGTPVIGIDADALRRLAPDLLITQSLCEVCAVADGEAYRLASALERPPQVLRLGGTTLDGVWRDIRTVGKALGLGGKADALIAGLERRLAALRRRAPGMLPRVLCVEWLDPLFLAGHWTPELVAAAGGHDPAAAPGSHSARREWREVAELRPDLILVMLCGFGVERSLAELDAIGPEGAAALALAPVWVLDGNAYTSRPGPRLVEGAERIAAALRGEELPGLVRWHDAVSLRR